MRITNNTLQRDALNRMQQSMRELSVAHRRATSGLRLERASDDPGTVATAMQTRSELRALTQYRTNVKNATSRVTSEETVLDQLTTALTRARELAVQQGTDTGNGETRATAKAELDEILRHIVTLGNTQLGGSYLFGGSDARNPPITEDPDNPGNFLVSPAAAPALKVEVSAGEYVQPTQDADSIFGAAGADVLGALTQLRDALASGDSAAIRATTKPLEDSFQGIQTRLAETGARTNYLQVTLSNLDALDVNLQTFRSDLEEVDLEKAVTELVSKQTAYQAAMMVTSRVIGMTLADYLR